MSYTKPIKATSDTVVHFLFTSKGNEDILLSFINAVLADAGMPLARKAWPQTPFNPQTFVTEKRSIMDIKAEGEDGRIFAIEFQVADHDYFINRILYYWSKTYSGQLTRGERYEKLRPVISIVVVEFALFDALKKLHNDFYLMTPGEPDFILTDDLQIHTLELTEKKMARLSDLNQQLRDWLELLYFSDKKTEEEMKVLLKNSDNDVRKAYGEYVRFTQDEELRRIEEDREKFLHDYNSDLHEAETKGKAEGKVETLLRLLSKRFGDASEVVRDRIVGIRDTDRLDQLIDAVLDCSTLNDFETHLG